MDAEGKLGAMAELLTFWFGPTLSNVEDKTSDFETKCQELDDLPRGSAPSDEIKRALSLNNTPEPLKEHLRLNATAYPTFGHVRAAVLSYST